MPKIRSYIITIQVVSEEKPEKDMILSYVPDALIDESIIKSIKIVRRKRGKHNNKN